MIKKLTIDQQVTYEIKIPGVLEQKWLGWNGGMTISVENEDDGSPITTLTCILDQAALQGLLRRLYSFGLPLISVICIEVEGSQT